MRRPPVVLIICAVLATGIGVAWANQGSSSQGPDLVSAEPTDPADDPMAGVRSVLSAASEQAAPADHEAEAADHEAEAVDHLVEPAAPADPDPAPVAAEAAAPVATTPPAHLEATEEPAAEEVQPVVTTTTAPPTTTTHAPPPTTVASVAFTASQAYGSCDEPIPYDIFSGTATPGTTVTISSPYGSGSVTATGNGHWEKKVEFPTAPRGETFAVTASGTGGSVTLHFTATGGDGGGH